MDSLLSVLYFLRNARVGDGSVRLDPVDVATGSCRGSPSSSIK